MKLNIARLSPIKAFNLGQARLRVTDPCYEPDTWCAGEIVDAAVGDWHTRVGYTMDESDIKGFDWKKEHHIKHIAELKAEKPEMAEAYDFWLKDQLELIDERKADYAGRVAFIHVWHSELYPQEEADVDPAKNFADYELTDIDVGVDSGQAGFFDAVDYAQVYSDKGAQEFFYDSICRQTVAPDYFGGTAFGAASISGWGDGGYDCYVRRQGGLVVAAVIIFLEEGEPEDESDEVEPEANSQG